MAHGSTPDRKDFKDKNRYTIELYDLNRMVEIFEKKLIKSPGEFFNEISNGNIKVNYDELRNVNDKSSISKLELDLS